jgi:hypothetical protein
MSRISSVTSVGVDYHSWGRRKLVADLKRLLKLLLRYLEKAGWQETRLFAVSRPPFQPKVATALARWYAVRATRQKPRKLFPVNHFRQFGANSESLMSRGTATHSAVGFLTVVEHTPHGLFGGYLLLNAAGRPLEFHCTAPVQPSRAQQILYGPTLEPYLYGEQIGATLIGKSSQTPIVVLADLPQAILARQHVDVPMALVVAEATPLDAATNNWIEFGVGRNQLMVPPRHAADQQLIALHLSSIDDLFDLSEPFNRIREAIEEAQRTSAKAA